MILEAYNKGRKEGYSRPVMAKNPYPPCSYHGEEWQRGFDDGYNEWCFEEDVFDWLDQLEKEGRL